MAGRAWASLRELMALVSHNNRPMSCLESAHGFASVISFATGHRLVAFADATDNVQLTRESNEGSMLEVTMPRLDESMRAGKLIEWLRKEGDRVEEGEPIAVVEGEKTTFEIEAPASGLLHKTLHPAGSEVPADEPIALIATDADAEHESARGHD